MKWFYRGLMAVSIVGGALVTGGILPVAYAGVAVALGTAAGLFHDAPGGTPPAAALLLLVGLGLSSCTATEKAALRECAKTVLQPEVASAAAATASTCGTDRECIEREAVDQAVVALAAFNACVEGTADAGK